MPSLRAKVSKTSGQNITRGAYKTANKLGSKGAGAVSTGSKKSAMSKAGIKAPKIYSGNKSRKTDRGIASEIIDELTKLGRDK